MAKRDKLTNTGNEGDNPAGNDESGFAPGVEAQIAGDMGGVTLGEATDADTEGYVDTDADTAQDVADQEAAGVTTTSIATSNSLRSVSPKAQYNALKAKVFGLGKIQGGSKTSMIALAEIVTEFAQDQVITIEQVPEIYDQFQAGVTKTSTYEDAGEVSDEAAFGQAPAKSLAQQLSKLRQFVILGGKYESDALDLIRNARNMHIKLVESTKGSDELKKAIKPGSTYSMLVDVARAQLKKQKDAVEAGKASGVKHVGLAPVLTTEEIRSLMTQEVKEAADKSGEDKLLDTLILARATAKGSDKRNAITSPELENAIQWLRAALVVAAPGMLKEYDDAEAEAVAAKEAAAKAKSEAEAGKARKAAEPKESKANRQAKLKVAA